ncbi:MAG: M13 family metallopeptidase [Bryobacteraceae bacterium]|nr:M13 family metallopeptidase [Bryobacteraceae bacterium]
MRIATLALLSLVSALTCAGQAGFSPEALDRSVNPCTNFYQFACGGWMKANPIPADQSTWGRFNELDERNKSILRDILETSAAKKTRTAVEQKIGDYYQACMDEKGIDAKGIAPLKPMLDRINALKDKKELTGELIRLHQAVVDVMFNLTSGQDFKNAQEVIAQLDQGGIGLPERDYYFKDDEKSKGIRKAYVAHVAKMFELAGDKADIAAKKADTVMKLETALAKGHLDVVSRRDPQLLDHRMPVKDLVALAPSIDWAQYLPAMGAKEATLNVAVPEAFKALDAQIRAVPLDDWKVYLFWHVIHSASPLMPKAFGDENFSFYGRTLTGAKEQRPRWKRCVQFVDGDLGEALGRRYVELTFGEKGKDRTLAMVQALEKALAEDIDKLDWMTPETKKKALEKLHSISNKIGFPEKWRDYSALDIKQGDAVGNSFRANTFEFRRQMAKIGKPVDKNEWFMSPPTVNAYYDPQNNNINFPAGILQPPFYDNKMDDAVNFGAIGAVIGHELTHGFDDQGSQFDAKGNLANWWTEKDMKEFQRRTECFEKQYASYTATEELKLNGKLTLGENTADNGGLRIAYMALANTIAGRSLGKTDGFTPEQRLFLGWGQIWCQNQRAEVARLRAQTDPHSPGEARVNGTVTNMPEFQKAFACTEGQPMVAGANACRAW